jgi:hypothetical protein
LGKVDRSRTQKVSGFDNYYENFELEEGNNYEVVFKKNYILKFERIIKTRSNSQIRSHFQKYIKKICDKYNLKSKN